MVLATNGYSSEGAGLAGRFMPVQSTVLVTRVLSKAELAAQGWGSDQMAYDTRNLLHYFRLMPDGRFLFGMRGGVLSTPGAERGVRRRVRRHFERMFPAWAKVETEAIWSGMVALAQRGMPYIGALPGPGRVYAALCYHGNGVAMGSYAGHLLGVSLAGRDPEIPAALRDPLLPFPLGRFRRLLMPPLYAVLGLADL